LLRIAPTPPPRPTPLREPPSRDRDVGAHSKAFDEPGLRKRAAPKEAAAKKEPEKPKRLWEIPKEERIFDVGTRVQIFGLKSETGKQLNGKVGSITLVEEIKGRYQVKLDKEEETKSIKPENIRLASVDTRWRSGDMARIVDVQDDKDKDYWLFDGCLASLLANGSTKKPKKKKDADGETEPEKPAEPEEPRWICEVKGQLQVIPCKNLRVCTQDDNNPKGILSWSWSSLILIGFCMMVTVVILLGIGLVVVQITASRIDGVSTPLGLEVAVLSLGTPWFALVWMIGAIGGGYALHEPIRDKRVFFLSLPELGVGVASAKSLCRISFVSVAMLLSGMFLLHQELVLAHLPGGRSGAKGTDFIMFGLAAAAGIAVQGIFIWEVKWTWASIGHFSGYAVFLLSMWLFMRSAGPLYTPELYVPADEASSDSSQDVREAVETAANSKLLQHEFVKKILWIRHDILMRLPLLTCSLPLLVRLWENSTIKTQAATQQKPTSPHMRNALGLAQWLVVLSFAAVFLSYGPEIAVAALLPLPSDDPLGGFS
jgi:hypothetical protein